MSSVVYNSFLDDLARGLIDFDVDTFKCLLVTSGYAPSKDTHQKRSHVTDEVTGAGYTLGGNVVTAVATKDMVNDRLDLSFSNPMWVNSTITAAGAIIYKSRGVAADDELVAFVDFNGNVSSINGNFTVTFSSPLRFQN